MKWLHNLFWVYGKCNNMLARKHRLYGNVQFILWKAGEKQGTITYEKDFWYDMHESWWSSFQSNKEINEKDE